MPYHGIEVYPRVCGVDDAFARAMQGHYGLSPRVRGRCSGQHRSCGTPVYPRVCGVDIAICGDIPFILGLSPRVRGRWAVARSPPRLHRFI